MKRFRMIKLPVLTFKHLLQAATSETLIEGRALYWRRRAETYIRAKWGGGAHG